MGEDITLIFRELEAEMLLNAVRFARDAGFTEDLDSDGVLMFNEIENVITLQ